MELQSSSADSDRKLHLAFWMLLAIGTFFMLANLSLPITRNALTYAKAALGIAEHHFNVFAIAHSASWTNGKPILFSSIAAPFVWLFNANTGTIIASAIGTAFFLWTAILAILRLFERLGLDRKLAPLAFVLVAFNPLIIYQFWSAYPDSLFAALVLLAFIFVDIITTEPERDTRWHIVGLGAAIYLAIHTKYYGALLGVACPLYLLTNWRALLSASSYRNAKIAVLVVVFAALALVLITAKLNVNPLLDLAHEESLDGGFADYVKGIVGTNLQAVMSSLLAIGFAALLTCNVALLFLGTRVAWRTWELAPTLFVAVYMLGLLSYYGTEYNIRYFLPILPFLGVALAAGSQVFPSTSRRVIVGIYAVVSAALVLGFNLAPMERALRPLLTQTVPQNARLSSWLDNLRLPVQLAQRRQIKEVNAKVPAGSVFYWSSDYYDTATHGLAQHLGIKKDLDTRYVLRPSQIPTPSGPVYLIQFTATEPMEELWQPPDWATVKTVGYGLFRLDPISVDLTPLSGDFVADGEPIRLRADISVGARLTAHSVTFFEDDRMLGSDSEPPFELSWPAPAFGRHEVTAQVSYGSEDTAASPPLAIYVGSPTLERGIKRVSDAAMEFSDGMVYPMYRILGLSQYEVGLRFERLTIPSTGQITKAYLQLVAAAPDSQPAALDIRAELAADASKFAFEKGGISKRPRTTRTVHWQLNPWRIDGQPDQSPDLTPLLLEVAAQEEWRSGNAVVLILRGSGQRIAKNPTLHVELANEH